MKKMLIVVIGIITLNTHAVLAASYGNCSESKDVCWTDDDCPPDETCIIDGGGTTCTCPSGYSGTCTGSDYSTCYKSCYVNCDPNVTIAGCPDQFDYRFCVEEIGIDTNVKCNTGRQYYGSSTCNKTYDCACQFNPFGDIQQCPEGYRDCRNSYNADEHSAATACCKILAAGTSVNVANGAAVTCQTGSYCSGGDSIYYGSTGGANSCPVPGTSVAGATAITNCYIPKGASFSDSTGSGIYTDDCYYTNN